MMEKVLEVVKGFEMLSEDVIEPELVDTYTSVAAEVKELAEDVKILNQKLAKAKVPLMDYIEENFAEDEIGKLEGYDSKVSFNMKAEAVQLIDKDRLIEIIGVPRFIELAAVSIGDIRQVLSEDEVREVLAVARTGNRTLKIL
jgi:hypothetical protein